MKKLRKPPDWKICCFLSFAACLFFLCNLIIPGFPVENKTLHLDLEQCLERAFGIDPEISAGKANLGIAEAQLMEAISLKYLPRFELSNAFTVAPGINIADNDLLSLDTRNDWTRIGLFNRLELKFIQPIYTFGRIRNSIAAARLGITAREAGVEQQRNKIAFRVTQLYYSRLLAKELITLADEARGIVEKAEGTLNDMLSREDNPDLNEADLFRIRLFKIELEKNNREIAKNNELTLAALRTSLDIAADVVFDISDEFLEARPFEALPLEHYLKPEYNRRPELAQVKAAQAAQSALTQVSRSLYYPLFFIGGGTILSFAPSRDDINSPFLKDPYNYKSFGAYLGISLPLNFRQTKARIIKAEYELDRIEAQRSAVQQAVNLEVKKAHLDLRDAETNMQSFGQALTLSREWKTYEQISFDLDGTNAKDLVDAVEAYLRSKAALFQAIFEFNVAVAELEYVTGTIGKN